MAVVYRVKVYVIPPEAIMPTVNQEVRNLRRLLAETGADPYQVAAEALLTVERLQRLLAEFRSSRNTKDTLNAI